MTAASFGPWQNDWFSKRCSRSLISSSRSRARCTSHDAQSRHPASPHHPRLAPCCTTHWMPRARWLLECQASVWRFLMQIGMGIHKVAPPHPPDPSFERTIPTALSPTAGEVRILFYVPKSWATRKKHGGALYPVVVNFHGGGFTLGTARDDVRWAQAVVKNVDALVACVDYRLAPRSPFPTPVEDGVDAVLYVASHAEELHVDPSKIAISGFSSGGNMAFTVPMRLRQEIDPPAVEKEDQQPHPVKAVPEANGRTTTIQLDDVHIAATVAWYPSTDYTVTRQQRRDTSVRKDQELSPVFTELFDESYLGVPGIDLSSPFLSPAVAPRHMLETLPHDIIIYTCEWDMLQAEGERLKRRLVKAGKNVRYKCIPGAKHGWDKAPNPIGVKGVNKNYKKVCNELCGIFGARV